MPNRPIPDAPDHASTDVAIHGFSVALVVLVLALFTWAPGAAVWLLIAAWAAFMVGAIRQALAALARLLP